MKKGCLSIIMMSIFIIGVGYYLWTRFGDDIERKAKERLIEIAVDNLNERVAGLDVQMPPDSLTTHIKNYLEDRFDKVDVNNIRSFLDKFITDLETEITNTDLKSFDFFKLDEFIENYEK